MASKLKQSSLIGGKIGSYEVEALIGRGAMGTVYLAYDTRLKRPVALKVLLGSFAENKSLVRQFHIEAQAAAPLKHRNIVRIYSAGIEDDIPYISMEFVDGEPLDRFLRRKGKLEWHAAFFIGSQIALALDCAHEHGVVHRDIKPSNIMIDSRGRVRLADFGIASIQAAESDKIQNSRFSGTPQYMSPEQSTGKEVGPASDLFSLGVLMYQMISGTMPFEGESSMALISAICEEDPPRLNKLDPEIPDDASRIVAWLMEKDPKGRPESAHATHLRIRAARKRTGDESSYAESITEFLKSEMEPRPFSTAHVSLQKGSGIKARPATSWLSPISLQWRRVAGAALLALGMALAFSIAPVVAVYGRESRPADAPTVEVATFQDTSPGSMEVLIELPAFDLSHIQWVGRDSTLLLHAIGKTGQLSDGKTGILRLDPRQRKVTSLRSPDAFASPGFSVLDSSPAYHGNPPEADSMLVSVHDRRSGQVLTLLQKIGEVAPRPEVILRTPYARWLSPDNAQGVNPGARGRVLASPDGRGMCAVLWAPVSNAFALFVRNNPSSDPNDPGTIRTSRLGPVLPQSVTYSPDGKFIAYIRMNSDTNNELWLMRTAEDGLDGRLVAFDIDPDAFAFSPDSTLLATAVQPAGAPDSEIRLIHTDTGRQAARLGAGRISRQPWHPLSGELIYLARGASSRFEEGEMQLWAVGARPPHSKTPLTKPGDRIGDRYAVSGDGQWIASHYPLGHDNGLVVYSWDTITSRRAPSRRL